MKNLKYLIKIPETISLIYCSKRQILIIRTANKTKIIRLKLKLLFINKDTLYVTDKRFFVYSNAEKKILKSLRGFTFSQIVKNLYQVQHTFFKKLKLVGVSYKVFNKKLKDFNIIEFKLGYSHSIFLKPTKNVSVVCYKSNTLFIQGNFFDVAQYASIIKSYKIPEVYKGKGILYQNETIKLKQGKKI